MYCKLFTSLYQGTLRGKAHEILVFTNLLAHCDALGVVDKHFRAIAEEVGLTQEEVKSAIMNLESPDSESRSPEMQGARIVRLDEHRVWGWRVVNYVKYRSIRNVDDKREQNRLAQVRWREKNRLTDVNSGKQNVNLVSDNKPCVMENNASKPMQYAEAEAEAEALKHKSLSSETTHTALGIELPEIARIWNAEPNLTKIRSMSKFREKCMTSRMKDVFFRENVEAAIKRISQSKFCTGGGKDGWVATFDWLLKPDTALKVIEGKYDNATTNQKFGQVNQFQKPLNTTELMIQRANEKAQQEGAQK